MVDHPTTFEQARQYRYNRWAGNPKGNTYNSSRCAMEVWESGRGCMAYQCLRKPGYGPASLYCKQHGKLVSGKGRKAS